MRVLKPVTITDAMVISSTVPETDYSAWSSVTTYAVGDRVIKSHKIWESLQASNTDNDPVTDASDPPFWLEVSSTNRWKMLDDTVNSATTAATSIEVELQPGVYINSVGVIQMLGTSVRVRFYHGATLKYDQTQYIDATPIESWDDYFFEPFDDVQTMVFDDLPAYLDGVVKITISGASDVACGGVTLGTSYDLGEVVSGATAGTTDYSINETNDFGVTRLVQRAYAKDASLRLLIEKSRMRRIQNLLASLRATPCLWIGEEDTQTYGPLAVFGTVRDFQIEIESGNNVFYSLEINGMI